MTKTATIQVGQKIFRWEYTGADGVLALTRADDEPEQQPQKQTRIYAWAMHTGEIQRYRSKGE